MNANLEEAANIATEYLSSLENLPNETQHILAEIKHRDVRTQELTDEIRKETQKYYRHSSKNAGQALSGKDAAIPDTVAKLYTEVDALAAEKVMLSERLVRIFERAMARLNHDIQRILKLQGDETPLPATQHFLSTVDSTVKQLQTGMRTATEVFDTSASASASTGPPPNKKRRMNTTTSAGSIKLPSPVPVSSGSFGGGSGASVSGTQKSGLSRQVHPRHSPMRSRRTHTSTGLDEEDAEGEEDLDEAGEEGGDAEDQELYCYCQKLSYGEMIACDNDGCRYQWFHLSCVNLKPPLPENWYCEECSVKLGIAGPLTAAPSATTSSTTGGGRKGRKKQ
ncbi:hypothetical protein PYCCODRAFT_1423979 [Trametes coccinea BRFM310]|uniref:Chromatin modification-related protein n=1 Tax=Trametes coccinea (strain BRFM310) TaxID=1353009 RepID=A0A1Y2ITU9_TRAC3|nr:hypothetical protein PYCCODRAFT_1423979 [Trametes coccinea BRFM310]